jgi:hypothetical protein
VTHFGTDESTSNVVARPSWEVVGLVFSNVFRCVIGAPLFITCVLVLLLGFQTAGNGAQLTEISHDDEEIEHAVQTVLADPEYRHLKRAKAPEPESATDSQFSEWLRAFLKWLFGSESERAPPTNSSAGMMDVLFYSVIVILALLLLGLMVSILKRSQPKLLETDFPSLEQDEAINPSQPPGDRPVNEYERRALAAAQLGNYRSALRELVLGAMSWTERSGSIRYRSGLTNRDYIRAVWRLTERRESLLQIVAAFERVFYGRREADAVTFESCLAEFQKSFSQEHNNAPLAS